MNPNTALALEKVTLAYGQEQVLDSVSLELPGAEIGCLLGPSGSGKSSLLRAIAGFEPLRNGNISILGKLMSEPDRLVPPHERQIGMVFQDHALFPHLSVAENIAFGLRRLPAAQRRARLAMLLEMIRLQHKAKAKPHQLSGGQAQRVALARALAPKPALMLLDEPFANLDQALRSELTAEVRNLLRENATPALLVTHDVSEALNLADRLGVLDQGRLWQWDRPEAVFRRPVNPMVARLLGGAGLIPAERLEKDQYRCIFGVVQGQLQDLGEGHGPVVLLLRPHELRIDPGSGVSGCIVQVDFKGSQLVCRARLGDNSEVILIQDIASGLQAGDQVDLSLSGDRFNVYPAS